MYEILQSLLRLATGMGEIQSAIFKADHGEYHDKGIWIEGIAPDGGNFTVSLVFGKVSTDAD